MGSKPCSRILDAITSRPWAITPEGLQQVLAIAQRQQSDLAAVEAVLAKQPERRDGGKVMVRDTVAIIPVMGPIFPRADFFTELSGATSVETLALRFGEAMAAPDVAAIVLHIDSPGGQITGIHEFASQIYDARESKQVIAFVSGVAGSAAYWLASAASEIVADKTAALGSIGVVAAWTDDQAAREAAGLKDYEVVSSQSPNKRLNPASKEGRAALQRELDGLADIFIADVARNRGKRVATVSEDFGQGGVLLAQEAVRVGMADHLGSLEDIITALSPGGGANLVGGLNMANDLKLKIGAAASESEEEKDKEEEAKKAKAKKAEEDKKKDEEAAKDKEEECATEDKEKEEESKAKAALMAQQPRLYQAILQEGVVQERARMLALEKMAPMASAAMLQAAKYTEPCSPQDLAMKIVDEGSTAGRSFADNYAADARSIAGVSAAVPDPADNAAEEKAVIDGIVRGMVNAGLKQIERR